MTFNTFWLALPTALLVATAYLPSLPKGKAGSVVPGRGVKQVELIERNGYACPDGLLWDAQGLWLADEGGQGLRRMRNGKTELMHPLREDVQSPEDIVTDGQGNYYFTDDSTGSVWRYHEGLLTKLAGVSEGLRSTEGIALSPDGRLLVGDGERHIVYEVTEREVKPLITGVKKPESLVFDAEGGLYIADNEDHILYYWRNGELTVALRDAEISPETIAASPYGLLITDSRNGRLYRFHRNAQPEVIASFGGSLRKVHGVTVDGDGHIYVSVQTDLPAAKGHLFRITMEP
jgi:sugar lactone lactonase YvrE